MWSLIVCCGPAVLAGSALAAEPPRFLPRGETVLDRATGLVWQRCSVGQRWDDRSGCAGAPKMMDWDTAQALRQDGWRLPTTDELAALIDPDRKTHETVPKIDELAFPNMDQGQLLFYWSSSPIGPCTTDTSRSCGLYVDFGNSGARDVWDAPRDQRLPVRLVATSAQVPEAAPVGPPTRSGPFELNGDLAKDTRNGLVWQRCALGRRLSPDGDCVGDERAVSFSEALHLRVPGWRLPTVDELLTLVDPIRKAAGRAPYIDPVAFPETGAQYMTSTPYGPAERHCVDFHLGVSLNCGKYPVSIRLVRAAP